MSAIPSPVENDIAEDQRHETSLERHRDYCRACDRRTGFSTAYRPRPVCEHGHRPGRHSPRGFWSLLSTLQSAGRIYRYARCDTFWDGAEARFGDDAPAVVRRDATRGLAAITLGESIDHSADG